MTAEVWELSEDADRDIIVIIVSQASSFETLSLVGSVGFTGKAIGQRLGVKDQVLFVSSISIVSLEYKVKWKQSLGASREQALIVIHSRIDRCLVQLPLDRQRRTHQLPALRNRPPLLTREQ